LVYPPLYMPEPEPELEPEPEPVAELELEPVFDTLTFLERVTSIK
jgi:hypothetical protein